LKKGKSKTDKKGSNKEQLRRARSEHRAREAARRAERRAQLATDESVALAEDSQRKRAERRMANVLVVRRKRVLTGLTGLDRTRVDGSGGEQAAKAPADEPGIDSK